MVRDNICPNFNHTRTNVTVRFYSMCGEIVNESIPRYRTEQRSLPRWECVHRENIGKGDKDGSN